MRMTHPRRWLVAGSVAAALTIGAGAAVAWPATTTQHTPSTSPTRTSTGGMMSNMSPMMSGAHGAGSPGAGMGAMGRFDGSQPFDVQFLDQMIAHHQTALVSTHTMIDTSSDPRLRALAHQIETTQSRQVTQMRAWRHQWYPTTPATFAAGMDPASMAPQMMRSMMGGDPATAMRSMMGNSTVDRMYLQMMTAHHQLGVSMAKQALDRATHPQLRTLAKLIIAEQTAQITQMRGYLKG